MKEICKKISVDMSRKSGTRLIFTRQNDVGARKLLITLTDGGAPYIPEYDCSVSFNFKRSDMVAGAVAASVAEDGTVIVILPQVALGVTGETVCSVSVYDSEKNRLTSSDFYLEVAEELYSGENVDDQPDYSLLQSLFTEVAKFSKAEASRGLAEREREANEKARVDADALRDEKILANLGRGGSIILSKSGWSGNLSQSVYIDGLGKNDLVTLNPETRLDREIIASYGLFASCESVNGNVEFTAEAKPIADVKLKYFITKGRGE